jgi:anti-sigma regulatory factor (Ser/Thr protein kinase)
MTEPSAQEGLSHEAFFYHGLSEYRSVLGGFLQMALKRDEAALAMVPGNRAMVLAADMGADAGRVVFSDMMELGRNPAGIIPVIRSFAERHAGARVNCVSDAGWPSRTSAELVEVIKHEALANLAFARTPIALMCAFDSGQLPSQVLAEVESTHPLLCQDRQERRSAAYLGAAGIPPRCEEPLPAPPWQAKMLSYRTDLRPVRALVADGAEEAGLAEPRASDLVLAVSEIAANTLRHTLDGGVLYLWHAGDTVVSEIQDSGWITDPLAGRRRPPADNEPGGHGLWLVNQVCDLVEIRTGSRGTVVRMHMKTRLTPRNHWRGARDRWPSLASTLRSPAQR